MTTQISDKSERYPTGRLNLLQTMGLLALFGLLLTVVLKHFFT